MKRLCRLVDSRNITMLSMQLEALVRLLHQSTLRDSGGPLDDRIIALVRNAISGLARHYHRALLTSMERGGYYSESTRRQLADLGALAMLREACALIGKKLPDGWPSE